MIFSYKKFRAKGQFISEHLRPMIPVVIRNGTKSATIEGILDTGADHILVNKQWAKALNIDLKTAPRSTTTGIIGPPVPILWSKAEIEILGHPDTKSVIDLAFIDSPNVGLLLGQHGFFDLFRITFDRTNNCIEIIKSP